MQMCVQVALAETKGAIGAVLYSDPKDFAQKGRNDVYNNSIWMPGKAAQLGTVYLGNGDPLTPNYPAIGIRLSYCSTLKCLSITSSSLKIK